MPDAKPRFEVEELEGTRKRTIFKSEKDDDGNHLQFVTEVIEEPAGWMVYFPTGVSLRIRTQEELDRLEFGDPAGYIDMESGEAVAPMAAPSLKEIVNRKTKPTRRSKAVQEETVDA